ncbi:MAG: hypothetical protein QOJ07_1149 [Thermoleophilaceae bacterium]|nr:hypothetical protein [Thermoleophilaceae bacterium]
METRALGHSGLQVSVLAFGAMTFGGRGGFAALGSTQTEDARAIVGACIEAGVNLFDTADIYSGGESEEILGRALAGRRDEVLLATKAFGPMGPGPNDRGASRRHLIAACDASLRRLGTDWIDLYQLHGFDSLTPLEETLSALDDLVRAGKVRYVGCSNYSAWHLMKALGISERDGYERYVSQQVYYSLVSRELELELVPLALDQDVGILVWSPLAGGFLTGKYRRGQEPPEGTRRRGAGDDPPNLDIERGYDVVEALDAVAGRHGASVAQVALAWLLHQPGVSSVIVGARDDRQLRDNLAAAEISLSAEDLTELDAVSRPELTYPYWHQADNAR